ncbi:aspartate--tRNA(Asp/Asn) ligase-like [Schistocerca gregaria]|uniref:aspartate--tRNA(Asp/Asn) ligase-like n=1 Tax=Schistocerca gregaria TaxID=7010 RepID=UPI00211EB17F|nr:aspartate--tRNA(Asp/Asn) ligase-like [Schistocerca gregaria]
MWNALRTQTIRLDRRQYEALARQKCLKPETDIFYIRTSGCHFQTLARKRSVTGYYSNAACNIKNKLCRLFSKSSYTPLTDEQKLQIGSKVSVVLEPDADTSSLKRTHYCGQLNRENQAQKVVLLGWLSSVRILSHTLGFITIRDCTGMIQAKFDSSSTQQKGAIEDLKRIPLESAVCVHGVVAQRPDNMVNKTMCTGDIEICGTCIQVINLATSNMPLPYYRKKIDVESEELKLKHRYLELRQPYLQKNIRLRSHAMQVIRKFLICHSFCEIETPTLFRKTSEGAREYLVPTRTAGKFYTLTQSPQQYKQLLMVAGFEKYFQIARCYRDEDLRADRQPEFTQIDMELSFVQKEEVMNIVEGLIAEIWKECLNVTISVPFKRYTYRWCMENYGSDKPDIRFGFRIQNVTRLFKDCASDYSKSIRALNLGQVANVLTKKQLTKIRKEGEKMDKGVHIAILHAEDSELKGDRHHFSSEGLSLLKDELELQDGDVVFLISGEGEYPLQILGKIATWAKEVLIEKKVLDLPKNQYEFFWVVDFPLFYRDGKNMVPNHHPFTAPLEEDAILLKNQPEEVRGQHYDLVLNGYEIAGGSIRIHKKEDQIVILKDILKLSSEKLAEFQHLLDALDCGCPPHGGIAIGFDRLMAVMVNAKSLRDVIAFPKSSNGTELMTGAPAELEKGDLNELYERLSKVATKKDENMKI